jgi:hypothetical protein
MRAGSEGAQIVSGQRCESAASNGDVKLQALAMFQQRNGESVKRFEFVSQ